MPFEMKGGIQILLMNKKGNRITLTNTFRIPGINKIFTLSVLNKAK